MVSYHVNRIQRLRELLHVLSRVIMAISLAMLQTESTDVIIIVVTLLWYLHTYNCGEGH